MTSQTEDGVDQSDEEQNDQDGSNDENHVCPILGCLTVFLNDIDYRVYLVVSQTRVEEQVAIL